MVAEVDVSSNEELKEWLLRLYKNLSTLGDVLTRERRFSLIEGLLDNCEYVGYYYKSEAACFNCGGKYVELYVPEEDLLYAPIKIIWDEEYNEINSRDKFSIWVSNELLIGIVVGDASTIEVGAQRWEFGAYTIYFNKRANYMEVETRLTRFLRVIQLYPNEGRVIIRDPFVLARVWMLMEEIPLILDGLRQLRRRIDEYVTEALRAVPRPAQ
jgi:hypothetical protein